MTISVALATYNGERYLAEQLASIAAQSRLPDELVVTDDSSTDSTVAIVEQFATTAPFPVRIARNETTLRSTGNFEKAVGLCGCDIIALCDQDDVWLPEKLARLEQRFAASPTTALVFTDALLVDAQLRPLGAQLWQSVGFTPAMQRRFARGDQLRPLLARSFVTGATLAFRSRYRVLALPFPTDVPNYIHDRWLVTLLAAVAPIEFIAEPLILYRQHAAQQIGAHASSFASRLKARFQAHAARLTDDQRSLAAIDRRLRETGAEVPAGSRRILSESATHIDARLALPADRWRRLVPVIRELASGRYHRASQGVLSAAKDAVL